jgi:hypothetical protein
MVMAAQQANVVSVQKFAKRVLQGSANFGFGTSASEAINDTAGEVNEP